jgi:hypothetical protein
LDSENTSTPSSDTKGDPSRTTRHLATTKVHHDHDIFKQLFLFLHEPPDCALYCKMRVSSIPIWTHLDMETARWGLVAPSHGCKQLIRVELSQAESVSPTDASRQCDPKVTESVCSGYRQGLHRLRTRLYRGRSAVDRSHEVRDRSLHRKYSTLP